MNRKLLEAKMSLVGITAPALAAAIKMSYGAFRMKLTGQTRFACDEACAIGRVLHLDNDELLSIFMPAWFDTVPEEEA